MGPENCFKGLDDYAVRLIRHKAKQLVRRPDFSQSDRQDIEQELVLDLLRRLPKYRPERAQRSTFIARVIDHKVASLLHDRHAQKRGGDRRVRSLSGEASDDEGKAVELGDTISEDDYFRRTGARPCCPAHARDLCMDIEAVVGRLPPRLRKLCHLLKSMPIAEAARELGVPRTTLYDEVNKLRESFEDAGLRRFLSDTR